MYDSIPRWTLIYRYVSYLNALLHTRSVNTEQKLCRVWVFTLTGDGVDSVVETGAVISPIFPPSFSSILKQLEIINIDVEFFWVILTFPKYEYRNWRQCVDGFCKNRKLIKIKFIHTTLYKKPAEKKPFSSEKQFLILIKMKKSCHVLRLLINGPTYRGVYFV